MPTWEERLTPKQKLQVESELRRFGIDSHQIRSLMKYRGRVSESELQIMKDLPPNRWGKKATISVAKAAIAICETLGLVKREKP